MSIFNLFRKSNSEDSAAEERKRDLKPLKEELNFSKNGYLFCSEGFTTLSDKICVHTMVKDSEICTLMAKIYENNNILIIDLFTEDDMNSLIEEKVLPVLWYQLLLKP